MAYLFDNIDIKNTYGIIPGQVDGGNISLQGCFDMPTRIGDVSHDWGDSNGLELYTASGDLFWGGRDITFQGLIKGSRTAIYSALETFYGAVSGASGLSAFSTPYGDFNVYVKMADPTHFRDISKLQITFREPVVTLTGGTLPATSSDPYMIDGIPMKSFGLYASDYKGVISLPEMKEQTYTKIESEGYAITKRQGNAVTFSGFLIASNLTVFKANIKNLYKLFTSASTRTFTLNNQVVITGALLDGFRVFDVQISDFVIARFECNITVSSIT